MLKRQAIQQNIQIGYFILWCVGDQIIFFLCGFHGNRPLLVKNLLLQPNLIPVLTNNIFIYICKHLLNLIEVTDNLIMNISFRSIKITLNKLSSKSELSTILF